MIRSMTGYGQAARECGDSVVRVEIRSVNNRYADIRLRLPQDFQSTEMVLRKRVLSVVQRGRVDVTVKLEAAPGKTTPLRIHALLDDASRHILAIAALDHEREVGMLDLMVRALRLHPAPEVLYLDNGSTYSGDALSTACGRLGIALLHAKPYDPEAVSVFFYQQFV